MRSLIFFSLMLLVACGDDDVVLPPYDAGTPLDGGPALDAGPLIHPSFACTVSAAALEPEWTGSVLGGTDISIAGDGVFDVPEGPVQLRVVVAAGDHLEFFEPQDEDPSGVDTLEATRAAGSFRGVSGVAGQSDGTLIVVERDADQAQVLGADFSSQRIVAVSGGFGGAHAVETDALGRMFVAGDTQVHLVDGRDSSAPFGGGAKTLAIDDARTRIFLASATGVEVFSLANLGRLGRLDVDDATGVAIDRHGFIYVVTGSDVAIFHPDALQEVDRFATGMEGARIAIGGSTLALLGTDGSVAGYGLGQVQTHACIAEMRVISPPRLVQGHLQQIRVEIVRADGAFDRLSFRRDATVETVLTDGTIGQSDPFFVYSGVGVAPFRPVSEGLVQVQIRTMGFRATVEVEVIPPPAAPAWTGELTDLQWDPSDGVIHLTGTATVPAGRTLTIAPGTLIWMDEGALLVVEGDLEAVGTREAPIAIFGPASGETWSQIHHRGAGGVYTYRHVFIAGGGNHADAYSYHRWKHCCPPVLYVETGDFTMVDSVIGDTPNKAFLISDGTAELSGCSVQRVGMGPEFEVPIVRISDLWVSEVRGIDDNDGIYFWKVGQCCAVPTAVCTISCGAPYAETSIEVDGLVLADGDDDGLDTQMSYQSVGGATHPMSPILRNVLIYGWADKGMSLAGGNVVMENVLAVHNRNLGIKADDNNPLGHDYPTVLFTIHRSTIAHNANFGLFFGVQGGEVAEFADGSHMTMRVSDSIVFSNPENIFRRYDVSTFSVTRSVFPRAVGDLENVTMEDPIFIDAAAGDYRVSPLSDASRLVGGNPAGFVVF